MQTEELISQAEYMRRYNIGHAVLKRMIKNKEVEMRDKKIVVYKNKDVVSRTEFEAEKEKRIEAEQRLQIISSQLSSLLREVNKNE